ncbi:MAG: hypothetical protein ACE5EH_11495 [Gammaproteobacteria bacterium]
MNQTAAPRLTTRQQFWLKHIRTCEASGKSIKSYAAAHGLGVKGMYASKKMLIKKGVLPRPQSDRFQRVKMTPVAVNSQCRICLPNGLSVELSGSVEAATLAVILKTAAALS